MGGREPECIQAEMRAMGGGGWVRLVVYSKTNLIWCIYTSQTWDNFIQLMEWSIVLSFVIRFIIQSLQNYCDLQLLGDITYPQFKMLKIDRGVPRKSEEDRFIQKVLFWHLTINVPHNVTFCLSTSYVKAIFNSATLLLLCVAMIPEVSTVASNLCGPLTELLFTQTFVPCILLYA